MDNLQLIGVRTVPVPLLSERYSLQQFAVTPSGVLFVADDAGTLLGFNIDTQEVSNRCQS